MIIIDHFCYYQLHDFHTYKLTAVIFTKVLFCFIYHSGFELSILFDQNPLELKDVPHLGQFDLILFWFQKWNFTSHCFQLILDWEKLIKAGLLHESIGETSQSTKSINFDKKKENIVDIDYKLKESHKLYCLKIKTHIIRIEYFHFSITFQYNIKDINRINNQ